MFVYEAVKGEARNRFTLYTGNLQEKASTENGKSKYDLLYTRLLVSDV